MQRELVHDKTIKGWRCTACGWAWPTPRFVPAEQNVDRACQQDFDSHNCSKYPFPPMNTDQKKDLVEHLKTKPQGVGSVTGQTSVRVVEDPFKES